MIQSPIPSLCSTRQYCSIIMPFHYSMLLSPPSIVHTEHHSHRHLPSLLIPWTSSVSTPFPRTSTSSVIIVPVPFFSRPSCQVSLSPNVQLKVQTRPIHSPHMLTIAPIMLTVAPIMSSSLSLLPPNTLSCQKPLTVTYLPLIQTKHDSRYISNSLLLVLALTKGADFTLYEHSCASQSTMMSSCTFCQLRRNVAWAWANEREKGVWDRGRKGREKRAKRKKKRREHSFAMN